MKKPKSRARRGKVIIEKLAQIVSAGFAVSDSKIDRLSQTVENLAVATKAGFDSVDQRFDQADDRLKKLDGRMDKMDGRLFNLEGDMSHIKTSLVRIEEKFGVGNYESRLESLEEDVGKLKSRAHMR
ncbi:MAG: hypothetical protein A3B08_01680 [Candidatus Taylorbacteria bacterium RIFCSPLOWO2_01_FULL_43_44]|uniref:t-SNARE coiled-coil homology domain-containing protein n=1 Tax=Candidatus Taylorbacteria bacterium RIFCSPHIGHO2_02_FULL_43_32b TaxID=1802306 RepID=A0A1G2MFA8_9BACT|nr:MAG: hypothetical protein A3C72_00625 [Candidatus Taylorbacteria bacterium RIFCSPHIGHO2_02_FULL_43_32b]OHA29506.1 MAG: hypothetical protein A3B08_01680 [Candidatus Taylorbacteria bacterium RIFCSPLOWO2_01_FULL_43_44]